VCGLLDEVEKGILKNVVYGRSEIVVEEEPSFICVLHYFLGEVRLAVSF